jgi:hypothetical protein
VAETLRLLGSRGRWLVEFDNLEDPRVVADWPPGGSGQVLVTTRLVTMGAFGAVLTLEEWPRVESLQYLHSRLPNMNEGEAAAVAEMVGDLPLAVEQAAAFLEQTEMPLEAYTRLWREQSGRVLGKGSALGHPETVATLWSMQLSTLARAFPGAVDLLQTFAVLAPEPIPLSWFTDNPDLVPPALRDLADDLLVWVEAVGTLTSYSLARRVGRDAVVVHRLVQAVVRADLTSARLAEIVAGLVDVLWAAAPRGILEDYPTTWPQWRLLLPHVRALLSVDGQQQSDAAANLAHGAAQYLQSQGGYELAGELYRRALHDWRLLYGSDHPSVLDARYGLAKLRGDAGDPAGAAAAFAELLADQIRLEGATHRNTFDIRNELARWRGYAGDAAGAVSALTELVPDLIRSLGADDPRTLTVRHNLASYRGMAGDYAAAADALAELLPERIRVIGPDHPDTLSTRHNLARWRGETGDAAGALQAFVELLPDCVRVLGESHPGTLFSRHNLARWLGETGNEPAAVDAFERLLPDRVRVLGADHPDTLSTRRELARWRGENGDAAGAVRALEDLLPDYIRVSGPDHPDTVFTEQLLDHWRGRG